MPPARLTSRRDVRALVCRCTSYGHLVGWTKGEVAFCCVRAVVVSLIRGETISEGRVPHLLPKAKTPCFVLGAPAPEEVHVRHHGTPVASVAYGADQSADTQP